MQPQPADQPTQAFTDSATTVSGRPIPEPALDLERTHLETVCSDIALRFKFNGAAEFMQLAGGVSKLAQLFQAREEICAAQIPGAQQRITPLLDETALLVVEAQEILCEIPSVEDDAAACTTLVTERIHPLAIRMHDVFDQIKDCFLELNEHLNRKLEDHIEIFNGSLEVIRGWTLQSSFGSGPYDLSEIVVRQFSPQHVFLAPPTEPLALMRHQIDPFRLGLAINLAASCLPEEASDAFMKAVGGNRVFDSLTNGDFASQPIAEQLIAHSQVATHVRIDITNEGQLAFHYYVACESADECAEAARQSAKVATIKKLLGPGVHVEVSTSSDDPVAVPNIFAPVAEEELDTPEGDDDEGPVVHLQDLVLTIDLPTVEQETGWSVQDALFWVETYELQSTDKTVDPENVTISFSRTPGSDGHNGKEYSFTIPFMSLRTSATRDALSQQLPAFDLWAQQLPDIQAVIVTGKEDYSKGNLGHVQFVPTSLSDLAQGLYGGISFSNTVADSPRSLGDAAKLLDDRPNFPWETARSSLRPSVLTLRAEHISKDGVVVYTSGIRLTQSPALDACRNLLEAGDFTGVVYLFDSALRDILGVDRETPIPAADFARVAEDLGATIRHLRSSTESPVRFELGCHNLPEDELNELRSPVSVTAIGSAMTLSMKPASESWLPILKMLDGEDQLLAKAFFSREAQRMLYLPFRQDDLEVIQARVTAGLMNEQFYPYGRFDVVQFGQSLLAGSEHPTTALDTVPLSLHPGLMARLIEVATHPRERRRDRIVKLFDRVGDMPKSAMLLKGANTGSPLVFFGTVSDSEILATMEPPG